MSHKNIKVCVPFGILELLAQVFNANSTPPYIGRGPMRVQPVLPRAVKQNHNVALPKLIL